MSILILMSFMFGSCLFGVFTVTTPPTNVVTDIDIEETSPPNVDTDVDIGETSPPPPTPYLMFHC